MTPDRSRPHRATLLDVARRAGVSRTAASFALSGREGKGPSGSAETIKKVEQAARELNYVPNRVARAMRVGRSDAIVLALGTAADPWGVALTQAVRAHASAHGLSTLTLADETWSTFLAAYPSDCAFITSTDFVEGGHQMANDLASHGVQLVVFSTTAAAENFDVIASDPFPAVAAAYTRLRSRHERVGFVTRDASEIAYTSTRAQEFVRAANAAGDLDSASLVFSAGNSLVRAFTAAHKILTSPTRPRALIASTAYVAIALATAARDLGLSVPGDLEIISIGDVPDGYSVGTPISYYGVDDVFNKIAKVIVDRALDGSGRPYEKHELEWEFIAGGTTREPFDERRRAHDLAI